MSKVIFGLLLFVALAFSAEVLLVDPADVIENQYLIIFKPESDLLERKYHMDRLRKTMAADASFENDFVAEYQIGDFHGFTAKLSPQLLESQKAADIIDYIEQDQIFTINQACSTQNGAVWGLDRISEELLNLDGTFIYPSVAGTGVDAYIIDTGIQITHNEFGGRAIWGSNFVDSTNSDCNGHGTHVAGTTGGKTYGIAKNANLIAVKVLSCAGSGSTTGIVQAISWVVSRYQSTKNPSVANMSLGGGKSTSLDSSVTSAIKAGITFVVAAGNDNDDACDGSPSGVATAVSVGATGTDAQGNSQVDVRAEFSNYGDCVTLFAPGVLVQSAWIGSNSATLTISGTSMAAPHVAGIVATFLSQVPGSTPTTVKNWLLQNTVDNMISMDCNWATVPSDCNSSPNYLVHLPC